MSSDAGSAAGPESAQGGDPKGADAKGFAPTSQSSASDQPAAQTSRILDVIPNFGRKTRARSCPAYDKTEEHEAHVAYTRIGNEPLQVRLSESEESSVDDADEAEDLQGTMEN